MSQRDPGLAVFVPQCLGPLFRRPPVPPAREVEGTVLFCDVSGFTPMTEALSVLGREGAEELTRVLNAYFTRMIGLIDGSGGDVLRFGGDAMTVLFEGPPASRPYRCALAMMETMGEFAQIPTRAGTFALSMKIGVAHGHVLAGLLGEAETGRDYYAAGDPLDDAADAEHHAAPGLVVLHPSALHPGGGLETEPLGEGFARLCGLRDDRVPVPAPPAPVPAKALEAFIPAWLAERAGSGTLGEHRGTAVVFLSLSGFRWDDPGIHGRIDAAFRVLSAAARRYGGVLNKVDMGDKGAKGILLFGAPYALERKEEMAARAALECLTSPALPEGLTLKAGVTSAPLFSGPVGAPSRREFTVMGDGINLAARLMGAAAPGQVLVSRPVREASPGLAYEELGAIRVKGKAEPIEIFQPTGESVGQEAGPVQALVEREALQEALRGHLFGDLSRPVAISGVSGLGKTALARWAYHEAKLREIPAAYVPLAPFSAEQPFAAWKGPVRQALGLRRGDSAEAARAARDRGLAHEEPEFRPALNPLLGLPDEETASLRGITPKERKDLTFAVVERLLARCGERVILLDGLQWADPLSLELLQALLASPETRPWRLAAFSRSTEPAPPGAPWDCAGLDPLTDGGMRRLLVGHHGLYEVPDPVLGWFQERAHGNPGTAAALLESLRHAGLLTPGPEGRPQVDEDRLFKTVFPDTLEGLYLQQVDRLPGDARRALQDAAVLGYSISKNLLGASSALRSEALDSALAHLLQEGLLREDTRGERPYLAFAVPLVRDAVYAAVPFAQRRSVHLAALEFLESEGLAERPGAWPALAHHAEQAEETGRARRYHRLAGRDALGRFDNQTALRHLEYLCRDLSPEADTVEDALSLMDIYGLMGKHSESSGLLAKLWCIDGQLSPRQRARARYFKARLSWQDQAWEAAEVFLKESAALYDGIGDLAGAGKTLVNLAGGVYGPSGQFDKAVECLKRALSLPSGPGQAPFRTVALVNLGIITWQQQDITRALELLSKAYRGSLKANLLHQAATAGANLSGLLYEQSQFERARGVALRSVAVCDALHIRSLRGHLLSNLALVQLALGRLDDAARAATALLDDATFRKDPYWTSSAESLLACIVTMDNRYAEAFSRFETALKGFAAQGNRRLLLFTLLEYLKVLRGLNAKDHANRLIRRFGGGQRLREEGFRHGLPQAFSSMLGHPGNCTANDSESLLAFCEEDPTRQMVLLQSLGDKRLTHEQQVRALLCRITGGDPIQTRSSKALLTRAPGAIWGLRILCSIYATERESGHAAQANATRRRALRLLYSCKTHSPDWVWAMVAAFPEIQRVIRGRPERLLPRG